MTYDEIYGRIQSMLEELNAIPLGEDRKLDSLLDGAYGCLDEALEYVKPKRAPEIGA